MRISFDLSLDSVIRIANTGKMFEFRIQINGATNCQSNTIDAYVTWLDYHYTVRKFWTYGKMRGCHYARSKGLYPKSRSRAMRQLG